jgi:hypothetical protein
MGSASALINILIRTGNRPTLFARCMQSIEHQTYKHTHAIVGYDNDVALEYIPRGVDKVPVSANKGYPFFYDLYCNQLKKYVDDGWFVFLDDDDFFHSPDALMNISQHLTEPGAVICQFLRNKRPKPANHFIETGQVIEGKIGLPCLFLHSKYKDIANLDGYAAGDYRYILSISERVPTRFVPVVVVETDRRSWGKPEKILP